MSEVPGAVEIYHRVIDCRELDISGSILSGSDLFQRDVTPRSPKHSLPQASSTTLQPQVKLELGHHATLRLKPTFEGYTHDWEVFLRSPEGASNCQIHHFVKRVEFHLHQSFSRQKIVQKEPPFKLNESGYAGFVFPIDVYFRNPGHPKKIRFLYDLILDRRRSTIHIRCEKLTFRNPPELFRSLLIKGGGQLVRRRHQLNDTGPLAGSALCRSLDVKPSLQSSGIEPDLSPNQQLVDSKEWFKVKQEVTDTHQQINQDKENQPQGSATQSKSSISFLQDWLRNIRSSKLAKRGSSEIGFDPRCAATSSEIERASFSSGIFSADSWLSEGKGPRGGAGGSDSWISEGKRARGGVSVSDFWISGRKLTGSGTGEAGREGIGGKGRGGERRALREMKQVNGNWGSTAVSSVSQPFAIKVKMADKRNETSQTQPNLSRKFSSRRGRIPTKFVPAAVSGPSSYAYPLQTALQDQTSITSKAFKTKTDILNSIIRRRLLKVKGQDQTPIQPQRPLRHSISASGIRSQIDQSLMPQTLKDPTAVSGILSPVRLQRRGPGRPRKNPLIPRPEKPDPSKRKRGRPPRAGPAARTRNSGISFGNPQGNDMGNSERHVHTGAPNSSDEDDIVFLGYSPPKQEPQNDADYGLPRQVSVDLGTMSGHARSRSVGRPRKVGRKRSTQLELLKSATDEFVGNAGGSGLQTEERVRNESSWFAAQPGGKKKRNIGRLSQRGGSNFAARLPSSQEREDDWIDQSHRRKKLRIVPVRCGSDDEDDEDTGVSDLSVEYPSDIYRSSTLLTSSNFVNAIEKTSHRSKGTVHPQKSTHIWMTSTPMKPKPPAGRQRSGTGQAAKRRNKEDVAWSRSGQNVKQSKRGRPRKVPQTAALTRHLDDLESADPLAPSSNPTTASPEVITASGESVTVLMELQQRLATLADGQLLKRVVQIVEESGLYQLDDAMFDFDLCNLDRPTIEKLKVCLR